MVTIQVRYGIVTLTMMTCKARKFNIAGSEQDRVDGRWKEWGDMWISENFKDSSLIG